MASFGFALKASLLLLLALVFIGAHARDYGMAPSPAPAMENGAIVGASLAACALALASFLFSMALLLG
ncbi:hypothetical protein Cni_G16995 [Canna indica]|uniref:Uncharacterized protein n=1 Tax=Canna indica TaxID=4628 RepID=A0AAQ3KHN5_9LILI|nr:hypothetical protein Cni_G16995 [Canna indica]